MITCQRCQTENLDGSQYCDECGAALSGQPQHAPRHAPPEEDGHASPAAKPSDALSFEAPASERPRRPTVESPSITNAQPASQVRASVASQTPPAPSRKPEEPSARRHEDSSARRGASGGSPHAKLVIHRGRSVGKEFPLCEEESHIGRWDADGGIFPDVDLDSDDPEAKVSRRHARITRRSGQYYIEDLGSTNGTFVNRGRRLLPGDRQSLRDGDEVIVGKTFLKFHVLN
jgi:FHA domain/zinc-ribbon domain